ncbi:MAG: hypothetical protein M5T61_06030 [Acidimicrobiia bacterium]|nr:hypothetical protein [Acidimicrobiia bacterium]
MTDAVFADGVAQRGAHVLLADQLGEALWAVPAVERLRCHALTLPRTNDSGQTTSGCSAATARRRVR